MSTAEGRRTLVAALAAAAGLLALTAAPASAHVTHNLESTFPVQATGGPQGTPAGDAFDASSGKLWVLDATNQTVDEFAPDGSYQNLQLTGPETPAGSFGFQFFNGVAVDNSGGANAGDVYVADWGNAVVDRFDSAGNYLCQITGKATPSATECNGASGSQTPQSGIGPSGLTVDSSGNLWVSDLANAALDEFGPSGNFITQIQDPNIQNPVEIGFDSAGNLYANNYGAQAGVVKFTGGAFAGVLDSNAPIGLAAEPGSDRIFASDSSPTQFSEYDTAGNQLGSFPAQSGQVLGGAIRPSTGELYANDFTNGQIDVYGAAVIVPDVTTAAATNLTTQSATLNGHLDPAGGGDITDCHYEYVADANFNPGAQDPYAAGATQPCAQSTPISAATDVSADIGSLTPGTTYHFRVVAVDAGGTSVGADQTFTTSPAVVGLSTDPATNVAATTATLNGSLDPAGHDTTYHFQYTTSADFAANGYANATTVPVPDADAGSTPGEAAVTPVDITDLNPATSYTFRIVATNTFGTTLGNDQTFTTTHPPIPPSIDSTTVANVSPSSAQLRAQINPNFFDSTYHFEVVDDAGFQASGFANATKLPQPDLDIGAGSSDVAVANPLQGLSPNTLYHYRAVAANANGPTDGPARTFITFPLGAPFHLPDNRAYEQVSPTDKNGADAAWWSSPNFAPPGDSSRSSADGSALVFPNAFTAFANEASSQNVNYYLSRRSSSGWTTQGINPPQDAPAGNGAFISAEHPFSSLAFTDNLGTGVAFQFFNPPLTPDAAPNQANLYRVGLANPASPSYQVITPAYPHTDPDCPFFGNCVGPNFRGASGDLSHVVFTVPDNLTPDAPTARNLYDWTNGQLSLVNIAPDGTPIASGGDNSFPGPGIVSPDGSRVFFQGFDGNLYVRENGAATVQIDAPGPGALGPGGGGQFQGASADGSHVVFADDASAGLTADTVPGSGQNLYLYDVDTGTLTDLTAAATANLDGLTAVSDDGSHVYFVAEGVLAGGAQANQPNLYVSHGGTTTFIATLNPSFDRRDWYFGISNTGTAHGSVALTPDGTKLAFQSINPLTGFDNTSANGSSCGTDQFGNNFGPQCPEVFLYDAGTGQLHCASCNPTGAQPLGPGTLAVEATGVQSVLHRATSFSSDGSRLFFQSGDALVGGDTNGQQDVYEYENGQVHLISNGVSPDPSYFLDASPSGNDAFFVTKAQLVGQDQDNLFDVYDARVGGGLPQQQLPPPCVGDACKSQTPQPVDQTPGSETNNGAGNATPNHQHPKNCRRSEHRNKRGHCVKRRRHARRLAAARWTLLNWRVWL